MSEPRLTRQGVRDLNTPGPRPTRRDPPEQRPPAPYDLDYLIQERRCINPDCRICSTP